MTTVADIAEAVKAALNGATMPPTSSPTFNLAFAAKRVYVPAATLDALGTLSVFVVAKADESTPDTRTTSLAEMAVDVAVMKRINGDPATEAANTEIDQLTDLTRRISTFFRPAALLGSTGARWKSSGTALVYDTDKLREQKVFQSVITLAFDLPFDHR